MIMNNSKLLLGWLVTLSFVLVGFVSLSIYLLYSTPTLSIQLGLYCNDMLSIVFSVRIDFYSALFSSVVCMISVCVFSFSTVYFHDHSKISYFYWYTFLFIASMLLLINVNDLLFVMLGWDGLGVVSFFLILYYQSSVSLYSGIFTLLMNRLGDCMLVAVIVMSSPLSPSFDSSLLYLHDYQTPLVLLLVAALATKSALFPFSSWLPVAMAAPTPISSLVHSSTLVTAGLWLMMRNYQLISSTPSIPSLLLAVGLFTSLYAGVASLSEPDIKKVVALSTLSHLGMMCTALGTGMMSLAFFHLIAHALFKSSLFISLGLCISTYSHYQDSRYLSALGPQMPLATGVILASEASLLGLPFLSGYYSKDMILEMTGYSSISTLLLAILYLNLVLTYAYSVRVLITFTKPSTISSLSITPPHSPYFSVALVLLSSLSVTFGVAQTYFVSMSTMFVTTATKSAPSVILLMTYVSTLSTLSIHSYSPLPFLSYPMTMMLHLSSMVSYSPRILLYASTSVYRSVENGLFFYYISTYPLAVLSLLNSLLVPLYTNSIRLFSIYSLLILLLLSTFSYL